MTFTAICSFEHNFGLFWIPWEWKRVDKLFRVILPKETSLWRAIIFWLCSTTYSREHGTFPFLNLPSDTSLFGWNRSSNDFSTYQHVCWDRFKKWFCLIFVFSFRLNIFDIGGFTTTTYLSWFSLYLFSILASLAWWNWRQSIFRVTFNSSWEFVKRN